MDEFVDFVKKLQEKAESNDDGQNEIWPSVIAASSLAADELPNMLVITSRIDLMRTEAGGYNRSS